MKPTRTTARILPATLLLLALAATVASCDKDNLSDDTPAATPPPVRFSAGTAAAIPAATPATRVAIDADGRSVWNQGDPVGIFMLTHNTTTPEPGGFNVPYTAASSGLSTDFDAAYPERALRFPTAEGKRVHFIAYHPYVAGLNETHSFMLHLTDQSSQSALDVLCTRADNNGNGYTRDDGRNKTPVNFTFRHVLAKLVLRVVKDPGVTAEITGVTINGMSKLTHIQAISAITSPGADVADITPCTVTPGARYEAILAPNQSLDAANTVTFTTADGKRYTWEMYKQIPHGEMSSGYIYTYDITLTRYAVSATGSIDSWQAGATDTGEAN